MRHTIALATLAIAVFFVASVALLSRMDGADVRPPGPSAPAYPQPAAARPIDSGPREVVEPLLAGPESTREADIPPPPPPSPVAPAQAAVVAVPGASPRSTSLAAELDGAVATLKREVERSLTRLVDEAHLLARAVRDGRLAEFKGGIMKILQTHPVPVVPLALFLLFCVYGLSGYALYAWRRFKGRPVSVINLSAEDRPNSYIGRAVPRPNLKRLAQGRAQLGDSRTATGQVYARGEAAIRARGVRKVFAAGGREVVAIQISLRRQGEAPCIWRLPYYQPERGAPTARRSEKTAERAGRSRRRQAGSQTMRHQSGCTTLK